MRPVKFPDGALLQSKHRWQGDTRPVDAPNDGRLEAIDSAGYLAGHRTKLPHAHHHNSPIDTLLPRIRRINVNRNPRGNATSGITPDSGSRRSCRFSQIHAGTHADADADADADAGT